ncbi:MAG: hypothetical protein EPO09_13470 [Aquabacterium sp.]|uniref:hypothetical protein n=1 Tax=Aquabacterium sp. TaxID=1872578 RepID=UPI0012052896|nr:hypothetical protein [Aquabacterium sp.]TAK93186.1 MAG: hypothetical protein EPO09_13470 [Aquabacterium sp.]
MNRFHAFALCMLMLGQSAWADEPSAAENQAFFLDAATCAAALEARVVERQTQARTDARDQAMLSDVEHGFVFIGVAYKRGLRNPQADEMLHAAEKRWAALPKSDKEARQASCSRQGQALIDDVSMLERFLVRNRASARVERLLEKERDKEKDKP